jgi:hypothetical protein
MKKSLNQSNRRGAGIGPIPPQKLLLSFFPKPKVKLTPVGIKNSKPVLRKEKYILPFLPMKKPFSGNTKNEIRFASKQIQKIQRMDESEM